MHFAAFAYVGESVTIPAKYYRNNVVGSLTLLEAARDHGIEQFVFSSTCATYGVPDDAAHHRRHAAAADQSVRRVEADGRAHAGRLRGRPWH